MVEVGAVTQTRLWLALDDLDYPDDYFAYAQELEGLGYDMITANDSLLAKPRYDPVTILAGLSRVTEDVKLATHILQPHHRNPVWLALQLANLDIISGGRTVYMMGLGAGRPELVKKEYEVTGQPWEHRGDVFEESIELIQRLWAEDTVTYDGEYYQIEDISLGYKPVQKPRPPVWIAAGFFFPEEGRSPDPSVISHKGRFAGPFDRVARLGDGWQTVHATPEEYRQTLDRINADRQDDPVHGAYFARLNPHDNPEVGMEEVAHYSEKYHDMSLSPEVDRRWTWFGEDEWMEKMEAFVDAGVETLTVVAKTEPDRKREVMERFATEILPSFR